MSGSPDSGAKTLDGSLFYHEGSPGRADRAPTPKEVPHFGIGSGHKTSEADSPQPVRRGGASEDGGSSTCATASRLEAKRGAIADSEQQKLTWQQNDVPQQQRPV